MLNFNKVILCGVVCNTPALRQNGNGTNVTNFTLKTIEKWKDRNTGDYKKYSKYHKIVVWGKDAEKTVKFVRKNVIVLVEGCLNYHKYSKDGEEKNIAEIKASFVEFRGVLKKNETKKKFEDYGESKKKPDQFNLHTPSLPTNNVALSEEREKVV